MTRPLIILSAIALALAAFVAPAPASAQQTEAEAEADLAVRTETDVLLLTEAETLDPFLWVARPIIVFADTPNDPRYIEQLMLLNRDPAALLERDVVVITDTNPAAMTEIRRQLRPRGFSLVLIGKDGRVELRKPTPWAVREITRTIDRMPLRQQEIRDAQTSAGSG